MLQIGTPADIYETPATRFVADFIGNVNLMDGTLAEDEADHCVIDCEDRSYVGHGITGTAGHGGAGRGAAEKIHLARTRRATTMSGELSARAGVVKTSPILAASPSTTSSSTAGVLKVCQPEQRPALSREYDLTWGDGLGALVAPVAVVLTQ